MIGPDEILAAEDAYLDEILDVPDHDGEPPACSRCHVTIEDGAEVVSELREGPEDTDPYLVISHLACLPRSRR